MLLVGIMIRGVVMWRILSVMRRGRMMSECPFSSLPDLFSGSLYLGDGWMGVCWLGGRLMAVV